MAGFFKKLSLAPQGLKYKLLIAFVLMSLIPLLVIGFLVTNYISTSNMASLMSITVLILVTIGISWLGLLLIKSIIDPIIDMSIEARIIAGGDYAKKVYSKGDDEIGELGNSINLMVKRIKDNINELKD